MILTLLVMEELVQYVSGVWLVVAFAQKLLLEQGAGIRAMLEPLLLADARPIRSYLEIGCSFGFGLDYARRILGWQVRGFDPGFIAAAGHCWR